MAFTVGDFRDLLRLLEQHPEWRAELRRHVLSDELLALPGLVRELAEAQRQTERELQTLTQRVDSLTQRVDSLTQQVSWLVGRVGTLDGDVMELRFARRAAAYLGHLARRLRVIEPSPLADMLDDAVEAGRLTDGDRDRIMLADVVAQGRRRADGTGAYFVVEVSAGVGIDDVRRALARAQALEKLGEPVVPVVAGGWISGEAQAYARSNGVELVTVPRKLPPPEYAALPA